MNAQFFLSIETGNSDLPWVNSPRNMIRSKIYWMRSVQQWI